MSAKITGAIRITWSTLEASWDRSSHVMLVCHAVFGVLTDLGDNLRPRHMKTPDVSPEVQLHCQWAGVIFHFDSFTLQNDIYSHFKTAASDVLLDSVSHHPAMCGLQAICYKALVTFCLTAFNKNIPQKCLPLLSDTFT